MNELIAQTGAILGQATELLKIPAIGGAVTALFGWLGNAFTKKSAKEKLELIRKNEANEEMLTELQGILKYEIEGNEDLQNELAEKLKEIEKLMKVNGIQPTVSNKISIKGDNNKAYQNIHNSTINDSSVHQTHSGSGDNVGRDKIVGK
jgi:hypothetical protein